MREDLPECGNVGSTIPLASLVEQGRGGRNNFHAPLVLTVVQMLHALAARLPLHDGTSPLVNTEPKHTLALHAFITGMRKARDTP